MEKLVFLTKENNYALMKHLVGMWLSMDCVEWLLRGHVYGRL